MEPKEKALQLIDLFKKVTTYKYQEYAGANYSTFEHNIDELKNCALILVDQCIFSSQSASTLDGYNYDPEETTEFWTLVKEEILLIK